jgi:hypothetical protein
MASGYYHTLALSRSPLSTTTTTVTNPTTTTSLPTTTTTMLYHPADTDRSASIAVGEVTAYGAAWQAGTAWPVGPVPIPIAYVTRAGYIWKNGETYHYDPSVDPAIWPSDARVWGTGNK